MGFDLNRDFFNFQKVIIPEISNDPDKLISMVRFSKYVYKHYGPCQITVVDDENVIEYNLPPDFKGQERHPIKSNYFDNMVFIIQKFDDQKEPMIVGFFYNIENADNLIEIALDSVEE